MRGLIKSELYKLLIDGKKWLIILAVLIVKCVLCFFTMRPDVKFNHEIYRQYIDVLAETPEGLRAEYVENENERLNRILSAIQQMEDDYHRDKITLDEFKEFMRSYHDAELRYPAFEAVLEKYNTYSGLPEEKRIYYFDLNCEMLINTRGFDYFLFLATVIILTPCFCREYSGRIFSLISVTERGRGDLYFAKLISACVAALLTALLFYAADFTVYGFMYGFRYLDMPICTVRNVFCEFSGLSSVQFLLLQACVKMLWAPVAAAIICMFSVILKSAVFSTLAITATVLTPVFLVSIIPVSVARIIISAGLSGNFLSTRSGLASSFISIPAHLIVTIAAGSALWSNAHSSNEILD